MICHPIPPVFDADSRILILGSFPSVKSRETGFYYGHPQNRFWKVLAAVFEDGIPRTIPEKKAFLSAHRIALWDVIGSCEIVGSSDSSITQATPNDLSVIWNTAPIERIFLNGKTAEKYYRKYQSPAPIPATVLPSTSPANAAFSLEKLVERWNILKEPSSPAAIPE